MPSTSGSRKRAAIIRFRTPTTSRDTVLLTRAEAPRQLRAARGAGPRRKRVPQRHPAAWALRPGSVNDAARPVHGPDATRPRLRTRGRVGIRAIGLGPADLYLYG